MPRKKSNPAVNRTCAKKTAQAGYFYGWGASHRMKSPGMHTVLAHAALTDKRLYKYRSMADAMQESRLKDVLLNHRIRFSRPSELNDPIEGKPVYQLGDWSSMAYRQQFEEWVWATQRHVSVPPPKDVFLRWLRTQTKEQHEQRVLQITADSQASIEAKWRMLSLSATSTSELMWSHYADGHKGVALVFDASATDFGSAMKVNYVSERVPMDITTEDLNELLDATILTKRSAWAYEEEYRAVAPEPWEWPSAPLEDQFLYFDPKHLLGVVFGSKTPADNIHTLISWVGERSAPLQYWKAAVTPAGGVEVGPYAP